MFMKSQSLKKTHNPGDHIDHVVGTHGMLPVTPGEYDRHRHAIEQSRRQKSLQRSTMLQAESDSAEEYCRQDGKRRAFTERRPQHQIAKTDE